MRHQAILGFRYEGFARDTFLKAYGVFWANKNAGAATFAEKWVNSKGSYGFESANFLAETTFNTFT